MDERESYKKQIERILAEKTPVLTVLTNHCVLFPACGETFTVVDEKSIEALKVAAETEQPVFFVYASGDELASRFDWTGRVGTLGVIRQLVRISSPRGMSIAVTGIERLRTEETVGDLPRKSILTAYGEEDDETYTRAVFDIVCDKLRKCHETDAKTFPHDLLGLAPVPMVGALSHIVCRTNEARQDLLERVALCEQLETVAAGLAFWLEQKEVEAQIQKKVRESIEKNQKEYYMREQIKVLHRELGDDEEELDEYAEELASRPELPEYVCERVEKELRKMSKMAPASPESAVSRAYIDTILSLPWNRMTDATIDIGRAATVLDKRHYGMDKVKDRILEYIAVLALKQQQSEIAHAPVLCFVGPPGVGKTSVAKAIAEALKREFVSVPLGGLHDEAEIRGHRRTYIGSMPGKIIDGIRNAKTSDPVFLLDEIDKISSDFRGDPSSALLEVFDSNQNDRFVDHYLDLPYDLSHVLFITTANSVESLDPPLLDRMEVIELSGYTYAEKLEIAKKYLLKKQSEESGVAKSRVVITDEAILRIIRRYTRESGVRELDRKIGTVFRKVALQLVDLPPKRVYRVTEKNLSEYLGKEKFAESFCDGKDEVGAVTGLAWTASGGTTLDVEVAVLPNGKGELKLTGNLGDVMRESAMTALSLVRSRAAAYGVDPHVFNDSDFHIHVPEGAVPKDGPSAGVTIATAILSALSGKAVAADVTMTGEVTLRGNVLAIGGLKEKSLAAYRYGKKRILIPKENEKDTDEIPEEVKADVDIIPVRTIDEVFAQALK